MLIFIIDDEPPMLRDALRAIAQAAPDAALMTFDSAEDALDAIKKQSLFPNIVFSDIEMPGLSGLEFAVALKTASPDTRVVFVTGFSKYAVDAFRVRVQGYIMKPLTSDQVLTELNALPKPPDTQPGKLRVRCFGHFEVFWQDRPVVFARKQVKELLAFLIDQEGRVCTAEEVCAALWEGESDLKAAKHRLRTAIGDLKTALQEIGMEDILIRERRQLGIRRDRIDCDYYRMLEGDMSAVNAFRGEYMVDYSWAELTTGRLQFRDMK
ncbi:MAG: response regulator [Oscillibacter sp.]|nr:response regulator [Oscillibacter sp.]